MKQITKVTIILYYNKELYIIICRVYSMSILSYEKKRFWPELVFTEDSKQISLKTVFAFNRNTSIYLMLFCCSQLP